MVYTSHGHHISGTIHGSERPKSVARCGGAKLCVQCATESHRALQPVEQRKVVLDENNAEIVAFWCSGGLVEEIDPFDASLRFKAINVPTHDGVKRASQGDTIIQHENGLFDVEKRR